MKSKMKTQCIEHLLTEFFSITDTPEAQQETVRKWMTPIISNSLELYAIHQQAMAELQKGDQIIGKPWEGIEDEAIRASISAQARLNKDNFV